MNGSPGWVREIQSGSIKLGSREATVSAKDGEVRLRIVGAVDDLFRLEDVVGRHLVRFGERDELTVRWERDRAASTPPDSQYISRTNESRKVVISAAPNGGS